MLSSAELVLWAIHHATTLLFGVFASAALCGVEISRRHSLELVGVGAVTGCLPDRPIHSSCICRLSSTCAYAIA